MGILNIPNEILTEILRYVSVLDLLELLSINLPLYKSLAPLICYDSEFYDSNTGTMDTFIKALGKYTKLVKNKENVKDERYVEYNHHIKQIIINCSRRYKGKFQEFLNRVLETCENIESINVIGSLSDELCRKLLKRKWKNLKNIYIYNEISDNNDDPMWHKHIGQVIEDNKENISKNLCNFVVSLYASDEDTNFFTINKATKDCIDTYTVEVCVPNIVNYLDTYGTGFTGLVINKSYENATYLRQSLHEDITKLSKNLDKSTANESQILREDIKKLCRFLQENFKIWSQTLYEVIEKLIKTLHSDITELNSFLYEDIANSSEILDNDTIILYQDLHKIIAKLSQTVQKDIANLSEALYKNTTYLSQIVRLCPKLTMLSVPEFNVLFDNVPEEINVENINELRLDSRYITSETFPEWSKGFLHLTYLKISSWRDKPIELKKTLDIFPELKGLELDRTNISLLNIDNKVHSLETLKVNLYWLTSCDIFSDLFDCLPNLKEFDLEIQNDGLDHFTLYTQKSPLTSLFCCVSNIRTPPPHILMTFSSDDRNYHYYSRAVSNTTITECTEDDHNSIISNLGQNSPVVEVSLSLSKISMADIQIEVGKHFWSFKAGTCVK